MDFSLAVRKLMIRKVTDIAEQKQIMEYRNHIVADFFEFSPQWLDEHGLLVMGEENSFHPYGPEAKALADMFNAPDVSNRDLVAVICDFDIQDINDSYYLQATGEDIGETSFEFLGRNFLLYSPVVPRAALLMPTFDVKFIAGTATALETYGGCLPEQKQRFKDFVDSQIAHGGFGKDYQAALQWAYSKVRI